MKRFSLIFLLVALFVCAFAITASAVEIPQWPDEITKVEGMSDKASFGDDGKEGATSRVLMSDGKAYPAYYICKDSTTLGMTFTELSQKSGTTYAAANVVRIEAPKGTIKTTEQLFKPANGYTNLVTASFPEGFTTLSAYTFKSADGTDTQFTSISLPSTLTTIGMQAFYNCTSFTELVIPEGVQSIPKEMARGASNLDRVVFPSTLTEIGELSFRDAGLREGIVIPEGVTTIYAYAFKGSSVTSAVIPSTLTSTNIEMFRDCASLETVVCNASVIPADTFYDCKALKNVTLENTTEIRSRAFYITSKSTGSIQSITIPDTVTTIGNFAFIRQSLKEVIIPASVTSVGQGIVQENKSLERAVVLCDTISTDMFLNCSSMTELVVTTNLTKSATNPVNGASTTKFITYYTGSSYEDIKALISGTDRITKAEVCTYEDFLAGKYDTTKAYIFVCDIDLCEVVYDGHLDDGNACIINCTRCGVSGKAERNPVHAEAMVLNYTSFDKDGTKDTVCTNPGCAYKVEGATAEALFVYIGHSAPEFIDGGMAIGYTINNSAIEEYEKAMGKTVVYGVFAVLEKRLEGDEIINPDETGASGVVHANVSKAGFSAFELKITGFKTDEQKAAKIIFGAYVITSDGNGAEVSYMQSGEPEAGKKYYSVSYSDIVG